MAIMIKLTCIPLASSVFVLGGDGVNDVCSDFVEYCH